MGASTRGRSRLGSNAQKIGRVENGGHQPLRGMTAEDLDPLGEDGVARGLSIGPRFFCVILWRGVIATEASDASP